MSKYVAPFMRKAKIEDVILDDTDFPDFGAPSPRVPSVNIGFKQTILNLIAKDQLDADERNRAPQQDPQMMTVQELHRSGWAVLKLNDPNLCERFNASVASDNWSCS